MTPGIAAASIQLHSSQMTQAVSVALIDKAITADAAQGAAIVDNLKSLPSFGHKIDMYI